MDQFKENVKEFVSLDDEIKNSNKLLKVLKDRRSALEAQMLNYMQVQEIGTCNINDGKIIRKKRTSTSSLTKETLREALLTALGDSDKATEIAEHVYSSRKVNVREGITRTRKKQAT